MSYIYPDPVSPPSQYPNPAGNSNQYISTKREAENPLYSWANLLPVVLQKDGYVLLHGMKFKWSIESNCWQFSPA